MPAVFHQVDIVQFLQPVRLVEQRFNHGAVRVVNPQHDMGQLDRRALAHRKAGRDTLFHGLFGRADGRGRAEMIIVILQIERHYEALAGARPAGITGGQHNARGQLLQNAVRKVLAHCIVDRADAAFYVRLLQVNLGQGEAQGRRRAADLTVKLLPVFRLGGILVAGDHGPFCKVGTRLRHQDAGDTGGVFRHVAILLPVEALNHGLCHGVRTFLSCYTGSKRLLPFIIIADSCLIAYRVRLTFCEFSLFIRRVGRVGLRVFLEGDFTAVSGGKRFSAGK